MSWVKDTVGWLEEKFVYELEPELDALSTALRDKDVERRLTAIRQLSHMKSSGAVTLLIGALRDAEPGVRAAAASALGEKRDADAAAPLAVLLGDADPYVRRKTLEALSAMGTPEPPGWFRKLFWEPGSNALGAQRVADYVATALDDTDLDVRLTALRMLPRHGAPGVQAVRAYFEGEPHPELRTYLGEVLGELRYALHVKDADHRRAAVETLHALYGKEAIKLLSEALDDDNASVRRAAVDAVTALGPRPALEELLPRLQDEDEAVVVKVIESLVTAKNLSELDRVQEDRIHEELLKVARRQGREAQRVAIWAVGQMARVGSLTTVRELLEHSKNEPLLATACEAIGKIDDPRAVDPLIRMLKPSTPASVVVAALRGLRAAADVRIIPALTRLWFTETRPEVEEELQRAFSSLCGEAEERARDAFASTDKKQRLAAVKKAIQDPRLVHPLLSLVLEGADKDVTAAAIEVLGKQGHDLPGLARATLTLEDKKADTRIIAIALFVALRPPDVVERMDALLADTNEPETVYRHTVTALQRIGTPAARDALSRHAQHPNLAVRGWVAAALSGG